MADPIPAGSSDARLLLCNAEMERAVLGAALLDPLAMPVLYDRLDPSDFLIVAHASLFRLLCQMFAEGVPPDPLLVADRMERDGWYDDLGGDAFLAECMAACPSACWAEHYADAVKEWSTRRKMAAQATAMFRAAHDPASPVVLPAPGPRWTVTPLKP